MVKDFLPTGKRGDRVESVGGKPWEEGDVTVHNTVVSSGLSQCRN